MTRLALVAGDFGGGTAHYEAGEFRFAKGRLQDAANVVAVEANATIIERHWGRAIVDGAKNAAGLAPLAMVVGVFAAPLAVVGTIGIAAAAVGGAMGLLGGGAETKSLIQVTFAQGTGFVAVCEIALAETITNDVKLLQAQAERERRRLEPPRKGWFSGRSSEPAAEPPTAVVAALPPPETPPAPGIIESWSETATDVAASATATASAAVEKTGQALSGAFAFARRAVGRDGK